MTRTLTLIVIALIAVTLFYQNWLETNPAMVVLFVGLYVINNTISYYVGGSTRKKP